MPVTIRSNHLTVPVARVEPNPWNYNVQPDTTFAAERASVAEFGFFAAVLVRRLPGDRWQIIDGEHRYRAVLAEGGAEILVNDLGDVSDDDAKRLTIVCNETRGRPDNIRLAALVKDLSQRIEIPRLAVTLPYSEETLRGLAKLTDWSWDAIRPPAGTGEATPPPAAAGGQPGSGPPTPTPTTPPTAWCKCSTCGHEHPAPAFK